MKSSSGESLPAGVVSSSHPYKIPQQPPPSISKYDPDFPLRKTGKDEKTQRKWIKACKKCVVF